MVKRRYRDVETDTGARKQYATSLEKERDKEMYIREELKRLGFNPEAKSFKEVIPQQKHRKRLEKNFEEMYKEEGTLLGEAVGEHPARLKEIRKNKSKKGGSVKTSKYAKGGGVRKSKYSL